MQSLDNKTQTFMHAFPGSKRQEKLWLKLCFYDPLGRDWGRWWY